jgi:isopenicillin N synthase-like dioxygenase
MGITKHSDFSFMTLLLHDQLGGLQILHEDKWVNVPPVDGALVVIIGDLLQVNITLYVLIYNYTIAPSLKV